MSNKVEGVVFKVYPKTFPGKPETYSIKIDGDPLFYRAGTNRFAGIAESGNRVTFEATPNPDGKSARIEGPVTLVKPQPAQTVGSTGTPSWDGRNNSIVYQSSRKDAIEYVKLLLANGALPVPKDKKSIAGFLDAALDRYTAQFFEDVNTLGAVTRELEGGTAPTEAAEEGDEDEE
jgi:hypothetical protein